MISRAEFAERCPALSDSLSGPEVDALLQVFERRELGPGARLLEEGVPSACAYLVWSGTFRVVVGPAGASVEAGQLEPGAWLGEVSLLDGGPASASAIAATPAIVLALPAAALKQLEKSEPRLATRLVRALCVTLAGRVRRATDQLESLRGGAPAPELPRRGVLAALRALVGAGS